MRKTSKAKQAPHLRTGLAVLIGVIVCCPSAWPRSAQGDATLPSHLCGAGDTDNDGVPDHADNCVVVANAGQLDVDGDGNGNACDADLNADGTTDIRDLSLFARAIWSQGPSAADFNGDNVVDHRDLRAMGPMFYAAPGPSSANCEPVEIRWDDATLRLHQDATVAALEDNETRRNHIVSPHHFMRMDTEDGPQLPSRVHRQGNRVTFEFKKGAGVSFEVTSGPGNSWWQLEEISGYSASKIHEIRMGLMSLRDDAQQGGETINTQYVDDYAFSVMGTSANVLGQRLREPRGSATQVTQSFTAQTTGAPQGRVAAVYRATSQRADNTGWTSHPQTFDPPLDLGGLRALKMWLRGAGKSATGAKLKIQLIDDLRSYRIDLVDVAFDGWRELTLDRPSQNTVDLERVTKLNLLYNNVPGGEVVEIALDDIRGIMDGQREVRIEDFEDAASGLWDGVRLAASVQQRFALTPASFGIVATPRAKLIAAIQSLENVSGLPAPRPGGAWNKRSPRTARNYLFVQNLKQSEAAEAARWALRGGFDTVLIGRHWTASNGHHAINTRLYPDGLAGLKEVADTLRSAGVRVGLHVMAPAVDLDDPYVTPVPDPGLVTDESIPLSQATGKAGDFFHTATPPRYFPAQDGGFLGGGTYVRLGNEIVQYEALSLDKPYGFRVAQRGALGTAATTHPAGTNIEHLQRSYGFFMFDLDTNLADKVTQHFCNVANAIDADMVYLDASERLQGGSGQQWYYNARLHEKYYACLDDPDTLVQASTFSHFSWHIMARHATSDNDGYTDIAAYYDDHVAPLMQQMERNLMPIDAGWYYVFDPRVVPRETEHALQKALGFDASFSLQTNMKNLRTHPQMGEIFDLVCQFDRERREGSLTPQMRRNLRESTGDYQVLSDLPRRSDPGHCHQP